MSETKKPATILPEQGKNEDLGTSQGALTNADFFDGESDVEQPREQIHEKVVFSTTFVDQIDLLTQNSLDFQHILALYNGLIEADMSTFSQVRRNALNIIDVFHERYRRRFSIPDRLVSLPLQCGKDGTYYLSLNNGFLCFYNHSSIQKRRISFPLVDEPYDQERRRPN
jgi:hypothetical protein